MNFEIFDDEIIGVGKRAEKYHEYRCKLAEMQWKEEPHLYQKMIFISNGTLLEDSLFPAMQRRDCERIYVEAFGALKFHESLAGKEPEFQSVSLEQFKAESYEDAAFILLIDSQKAQEQWFDILQLCAEKAGASAKNKLLIAMLLPALRAIPDGISKLQEREYAFFLEKMAGALSESEQFVVRFEAAARAAFRAMKQGKMNYLRYDNLYGATGTYFPAYAMEEMVRSAFAEGKVTVTKEDRLNAFSCMYAEDAALSLLAALYYGTNGHVYNVTKDDVTAAELKEKLQKFFPDKIALVTDGQTYHPSELQCRRLSGLKFLHEQAKLTSEMKEFDTAFYAAVCAWMDLPFDVESRLTCYEGKLQRLKSAEIDILKEIDRICKKHNIRYFLAGGSCLGAIRENKSIPWDDDLDIGMLREDFEKFRKIAPQELDKKYVYSSPDQDPNCHYYFDKIRLSDTYFSTFYSNKFVFDDGVFVDIVVYDQTTKNRLRHRWQIRLLSAMVRLINLRWHGYPTGKGKLRLIAKYILPIINRMPFKWLHKRYNRYATRYMKRKNAEWVLDGGTHLVDGPFRRDFIKEIEYVDFDGMKDAPIPAGYDGYLSFLYGENYRPAPPISSRLGAHKIARLDLGKYLFEDAPAQKFRAVDIRGELFETEDER